MAHMDIGNRLAIYGWKQETEDFKLLLAKVWQDNGYKRKFRNVEQLLFQPTFGSLPFVADVRKESKLYDKIAEEEILQTLSNFRKNRPEMF